MDFREVDQSTVHPNLIRFARYCENLAAGDDMPPARLFEVRDAPWLFGFIAVADVLGSGADYRYSFAGDFWRVMLNYRMDGVRLSELEECGRFPNVRSNYDAALRYRAPRYRSARMTWPDGKYFRYERLVTPFSDEEGGVGCLVIAAQCDRSMQDLMTYRGAGEAKLTLEITAPVEG